MIEVLLDSPIVFCWGISVLLPIFYWLLFGFGSKLHGIGLRFFDTALRSIILSETIGLAGSLITTVLVPESASMVVVVALWASPLVVITAYLSQMLRRAIETTQYQS
ncbi:MAG: hypothetical protein K9W43_06235 [Candidatus Thorarchaeota archaeon]|nr:hypothetical protein [Candidatus Thorarchaeota archaeon]